MTADEVLRVLADYGVTLRTDGDTLCLRPAKRVPPDLRSTIEALKPALLIHVRAYRDAVTRRVKAFRKHGQPWVLRAPSSFEPWVCFSCGDCLTDVLFGRCRPCSEALWRVLMEDDDTPWPGRPH